MSVHTANHNDAFHPENTGCVKIIGVREQVRVIIGGAPISQHYADQVGADGYSENARTAVLKARNWLEHKTFCSAMQCSSVPDEQRESHDVLNQV